MLLVLLALLLVLRCTILLPLSSTVVYTLSNGGSAAVAVMELRLDENTTTTLWLCNRPTVSFTRIRPYTKTAKKKKKKNGAVTTKDHDELPQTW